MALLGLHRMSTLVSIRHVNQNPPRLQPEKQSCSLHLKSKKCTSKGSMHARGTSPNLLNQATGHISTPLNARYPRKSCRCPGNLPYRRYYIVSLVYAFLPRVDFYFIYLCQPRIDRVTIWATALPLKRTGTWWAHRFRDRLRQALGVWGIGGP